MSSKGFVPLFLFAAIFIFGRRRGGIEHSGRGNSRLFRRRLFQAIEILNREAAASPRDAGVATLLARCYFESEQFDRAIPAAEAAISLDTRIPRITNFWAAVRRKSRTLRLVMCIVVREKAAQGI